MKEYIFYQHFGCDKLHFNTGDIRRCEGRWVHREEIREIVLVEKERVKEHGDSS